MFRVSRGIPSILAVLILATPLGAQQVTGQLGSPSATTTIQGNQIPAPPPPFGGVIKQTVDGSKTWWPPRVVPPKGAPNVLLIMTDDQGYGVSGGFGGIIPTPALDRIAKAGLRYTQFGSTALCSPTRAALITGRNHHSTGNGVITELSTGYPGYDSIIGTDNATIGAILKGNGYTTSWFGKNHNTPAFQYSVAGPVRSVAVGHGLRLLLRLHGRRDRPVDALPVPEQPAGLSVHRQARLQPHHRHGGRGDQLHGSARRGLARPALLRLLRPGRIALPAPAQGRVGREVQGQVRHGLEQDARGDLRQSEEAGRRSRQREADRVARQPAKVGFAHGGSEEALRTAGRGVRRLHCLHRPRDWPRDPAGRGHGQARQHADHLHRRRQRHQPRGHVERHAQPVDVVQRHPGFPDRRAAQVLRRLGLCGDVSPHGGGLVLGVRHAVQVDQAGRLALRRNAPGPGDFVAGPDQGRRGHTTPVPPHYRHRSHDPGGGGNQGARIRRRHQAEADRGREHAVYVRQGERECCRRPARPSISR